MKSATSSPVHLCFALPYFEQASYIFFNSSSVKGSLCLACSMSRPFGFFTASAGLRVIHSLLTQYSKNGFSIAIRRAPVCGLIAHEVRNSRTSDGFPLIDHDVSARCREFLQLGKQKPVLLVRAGRDGFLKLGKESLDGVFDGDTLRASFARRGRLAYSGSPCPKSRRAPIQRQQLWRRPFPLACSLAAEFSLKRA